MAKKNMEPQPFAENTKVVIGKTVFVVIGATYHDNSEEKEPLTGLAHVLLQDKKQRKYYLVRDRTIPTEPIFWLRDESHKMKYAFRGRPCVVAIVQNELKDLTYTGVK